MDFLVLLIGGDVCLVEATTIFLHSLWNWDSIPRFRSLKTLRTLFRVTLVMVSCEFRVDYYWLFPFLR